LPHLKNRTYGPKNNPQNHEHHKEKLDRLLASIEDVETEMIMLEQRVQSLCDAMNRAGCEQSGLITQIIRDVSAIRRAQTEQRSIR